MTIEWTLQNIGKKFSMQRSAISHVYCKQEMEEIGNGAMFTFGIPQLSNLFCYFIPQCQDWYWYFTEVALSAKLQVTSQHHVVLHHVILILALLFTSIRHYWTE